MNFEQASQAFLDSSPGESPQTVSTYRVAMSAFGKFIEQDGTENLNPETPLSEFPEDFLRLFVNWLTKKGYSDFSRNTYLAAMKSFLRYHNLSRNLNSEFDVVRAYDLTRDKTKLNYPQVHPPKELPVLVTYYDNQPLPELKDLEELGEDEAKKKRFQLKQRRLILLRNRAILHTLYSTAGRVSEVAGLTRQAVDEGRADEVLITSKGNKQRLLYFTQDTMKAIQAYLAERDDHKTGLFVSHQRNKGSRLSRHTIWRIVKEAANAAGLDNISPHTFRHWRASQLLNDDVPLEIIQDLLGHSDISTTKKVYAQNDPRRVRSYFDQHSPSPQEALDKLNEE